MQENGAVPLDQSMDFFPRAAGPSAAPGTPEDHHQTTGVSHDMNSPNIHETWSLKAEEFSADHNKFLSGPGVIPAQGVVSLPQVPAQSQDTSGSRNGEMVSFDDQRSPVPDQSSPGELGEPRLCRAFKNYTNIYHDRPPKPKILGGNTWRAA